jgi:hypothetical protein
MAWPNRWTSWKRSSLTITLTSCSSHKPTSWTKAISNSATIQSTTPTIPPELRGGSAIVLNTTIQHIQCRNPGTFLVESPMSDRGRPIVCAGQYYLTQSPHANGQGRNPPLQLSLQPPPQCTPKRRHPTPHRATWTQATATIPAQQSPYQILVYLM